MHLSWIDYLQGMPLLYLNWAINPDTIIAVEDSSLLDSPFALIESSDTSTLPSPTGKHHRQ